MLNVDMETDSCDTFSLKDEPDSDSEVDKQPRNGKKEWNSENTFKLIKLYQNNCSEMWDTNHPLNKDRSARMAKQEYLAEVFETTSDEISRKIHNLRTQFNHELRKIKRRRATTGGEDSGTSGWEYFDALSFLTPQPAADPLEAVEVNLALAEFQAKEEVEFGARARAAKTPGTTLSVLGCKSSRIPNLRVAASAPPPLPPNAHPMLWPEEPVPRIRSNANGDECQIFGDFVASELRTLRSDEARKRLKRLIQKAILDIGEQEDFNSLS